MVKAATLAELHGQVDGILDTQQQIEYRIKLIEQERQQKELTLKKRHHPCWGRRGDHRVWWPDPPMGFQQPPS